MVNRFISASPYNLTYFDTMRRYYTLLDFVAPNLVGKDQREFDARFAEPISAGQERKDS